MHDIPIKKLLSNETRHAKVGTSLNITTRSTIIMKAHTLKWKCSCKINVRAKFILRKNKNMGIYTTIIHVGIYGTKI